MFNKDVNETPLTANFFWLLSTLDMKFIFNVEASYNKSSNEFVSVAKNLLKLKRKAQKKQFIQAVERL